MKLHEMKPAEGSRFSKKRIGRGEGSTRGGTSTKGHKGAQSRSGYKYRPWFEGGQMPLYRRIPKFGFKNRNRVEYVPVNLDMIQDLAAAHNATEIDPEFLAEHGIIAKATELIKVLGRGEIKTAVTVKATKFSASAKQAIESAGGTVIEI